MSTVVERVPLVKRLHRFLRKPRSEKARSLRFRFKWLWNRLLPKLPLPVRLTYGGWWLARNDNCGDAIFNGNFEELEWRFVERFLRPGMTVLDIGAHHGFYTMLASFKVGRQGRVIAFEPSPRERTRLVWHLRLNRCRNVELESFALASYNGESELFVVDGRGTGCNSLRRPNVSEPIHPVRVPVTRLDDYLNRRGINQVDFIKMDVEGAELEVFKGATQLLKRRPRPVWLVEVQDIRTEPWGYRAAEIFDFLVARNYNWFSPDKNGTLILCSAPDRYRWDNLLAVPTERLPELRELIQKRS